MSLLHLKKSITKFLDFNQIYLENIKNGARPPHIKNPSYATVINCPTVGACESTAFIHYMYMCDC